MRHFFISALLGTLFWALAVQAEPASHLPRRTLEVGPDKPHTTLAAAAAAARDGDRIVISAGLRQECAVWRANNLLIEGAGADVTVIADRPCQGKGLFVITGANTTVRNLTLARAAVPDHNGAGIRAEGPDLTVENVTFEDNENGILSGPHPTSRITIRNSHFVRNGSCAAACAHGIYIGGIAALRVERSVFRDTREAHHIKSRARISEIINNDIDDGAEGTSSYLIDLPHGGTVLIRGNKLRKGPLTQNNDAAIMIGVDPGHHPTKGMRVEDNVFRNDAPKPAALVENRTTTPVILRRNRLTGQVVRLRGPGSVD